VADWAVDWPRRPQIGSVGVCGHVPAAIVCGMCALLDLVLPARCAGCGGPTGPGCPRCLDVLAAPARWTRPVPAPPGLPPVATVATYEDPVRSLLIAYKEHGAVALARPLGAALARAVVLVTSHLAPSHWTGSRPVLLVPVPSSVRQSRRRGADVVAELAACAARELRAAGRTVQVVRALRHVRAVADSAGLDARARAANAVGALGLRRGAGPLVAGRAVVLVDDLVTTGASLSESTHVLRLASASVVAAATVAATHRRPLGSQLGGRGIPSPAAQPQRRGLRC
jgi:predicted amidophosphoribosyltransferase